MGDDASVRKGGGGGFSIPLLWLMRKGGEEVGSVSSAWLGLVWVGLGWVGLGWLGLAWAGSG